MTSIQKKRELPVCVLLFACIPRLLSVFFFFFTLPGVVQAQFTFTTNNGAITITGYTGSGGSVVIPDTTNGYPVTSIGDYAFLNSTMTNVSIPDSITNIGMNAFAQCDSLTSIIIPDSVTNIEFGAFEGCIGLMNVTLPNNIADIGDELFYGCMSLTNIAIPNTVTSIGNSAFGGCISLGSIPIPSSVTNIDLDAFLYCTNMTNICVAANNPDYSSLNGVLFDKAQDTLVECPSGLTNSMYAIPNGVLTIAEDAFDFCRNVTSFAIPGTVINIIGPPFNDCIGLTNIDVNATNPAYCSLNGVLFDKEQNILLQYPPGLADANYTIPNSVTAIQGDAFSFCANLISITIPNSVTNIGEWGTFLGCSSLANITIPNGVTIIPDDAFDNCTSLANVTIPNSVTNIGMAAFQQCSSLTNVIIPASVTTIGNFAFADEFGLASAYFEGNAPPNNPSIFYNDPVTIYYVSGTSGWDETSWNVPTQLWFQPLPQVLTFEPSFGLQNNQFGFTISWATNISVIVQACTNLTNPNWIPVATNSLSSGTNYFSDAQWTNYPCRFYRISSQ